MWQDFFYPCGLVAEKALHHWRYFRVGREEIVLQREITAMSLNAGPDPTPKQLNSFWEVKGDVLQHVQPGRLIGNGISQLAPSAAELDS